MRVLCLQERLTHAPPESQMDLVTMKLENMCWRGVPSNLKLDAVGVADGETDEMRTIARFRDIQAHVDKMFGEKPSTTSASDKDESTAAAAAAEATRKTLLAGSIDILVASLPKIFIKYHDFWPTDLFLQTLLHFHSLQTFTESVGIMSLVSLK